MLTEKLIFVSKKFVVTDFGMPFFIKIDSVILLNMALPSNPIIPFTANTIGENNPLSICNMRSLYILFFFICLEHFLDVLCSIPLDVCVKSPYSKKHSLVWNPKVFCTDIKPCFA